MISKLIYSESKPQYLVDGQLWDIFAIIEPLFMRICVDISKPQIREQMLVPDLYVFTLKFEIPQQPIKMD